MKQIEAVFFDVGGVLFEIDWRRTLNHLEITNPLAQFDLSQKFIDWDIHHDYERGDLTDDDFIHACLDFFADELKGQHFSPEHMRTAWHELVIGPVPGIESVLDRLPAKTPIFTLSNTNTLHFNKYSQHPLFSKFTKLYTSFNLNDRKPDRAIYEKAAAAVQLLPEQCLFIDDLEDNLEAARAVGFRAEHSKDSSANTAKILEEYGILS